MNRFTTFLAEQARGAWSTIWLTVRVYADDQGLTWAGAIGLYLFLSIPPFMVATAYVAALFVPPDQAESFVIEQVAKYLPSEQGLLEGIVESRPTEAIGGAISVALLLFSGSRAFAALTSAINVMWRRVDRLTFVRRQALRFGMLFVTLVLLTVAALGEALVFALFGAGTSSQELWLLDWQLIPAFLLGAFLLVAYKLLPREPVSWVHA
ncbi:MAG: YihY/virulence factor BrkB family protein, partial [Chloroflexota bacterium]|nr:YihY/virulence factor BrkB family protein [Chloroflexota bacterium]